MLMVWGVAAGVILECVSLAEGLGWGLLGKQKGPELSQGFGGDRSSPASGHEPVSLY